MQRISFPDLATDKLKYRFAQTCVIRAVFDCLGNTPFLVVQFGHRVCVCVCVCVCACVCVCWGGGVRALSLCLTPPPPPLALSQLSFFVCSPPPFPPYCIFFPLSPPPLLFLLVISTSLSPPSLSLHRPLSLSVQIGESLTLSTLSGPLC